MTSKKINKNKKTKTMEFLFVLGVCFQIKALQEPFLPKYPPNLPTFPLTCPKRTK